MYESEYVRAYEIPEFDAVKYPVIYHYTTPEGMLSILNEKEPCLWFSRYDCLNDYSEGEDINKQYETACQTLYAKEMISEDFHEKIYSLRPYSKVAFFFPTPNFGTQKEFEAYVCCFSEGNDFLPMWNYYAKGYEYQGYSIGFKTNMFIINRDKRREEFFSKNGFCRIIIAKVYYSEIDKQDLLCERILKFYDRYKYSKNEDELREGITGMLRNFRLLFKNKAFEHEQEIRVIVLRPNYLSNPEEISYELPHIEYRHKAGLVIPYISMRFEQKKKSVDSVMIGPLAKMENAEKTLNSMLGTRKYVDTKVYRSVVPIRY